MDSALYLNSINNDMSVNSNDDSVKSDSRITNNNDSDDKKSNDKDTKSLVINSL